MSPEIEKIYDALPVLRKLECTELQLPDYLLPFYIRKAWKFNLPNCGRHVVVLIGGRSQIPGEPGYLSHISWRKDDCLPFTVFQADSQSDSASENRLISDYISYSVPNTDTAPAVQETENGVKEQPDPDCVVTKEPDRIEFRCKLCGCEFNTPANMCGRTTSVGCGGKFGGRTYVWLSHDCPRCKGRCSTEYCPKKQESSEN